MHKKYASDGLQVITVSLDTVDGGDKETLDRVMAFLRASEANFTNVLLTDQVDRPQKFHFVAPPCYFVFDKQGKWHQFKGEEKPIDYEAMEKLVVRLLKEK
jgi:hypothetical protein